MDAKRRLTELFAELYIISTLVVKISSIGKNATDGAETCKGEYAESRSHGVRGEQRCFTKFLVTSLRNISAKTWAVEVAVFILDSGYQRKVLNVHEPLLAKSSVLTALYPTEGWVLQLADVLSQKVPTIVHSVVDRVLYPSAPPFPSLLAMNSGENQTQSLLSTSSPTTDSSGAGSTATGPTSPNSIPTPINPTPDAAPNPPPEPSRTREDVPAEEEDSQVATEDKGRGPEAEDGEEGRRESVRDERETASDPVNVQIELLEHTPDTVVDDGQDWAADGDHEMKRVKVSASISISFCAMSPYVGGTIHSSVAVYVSRSNTSKHQRSTLIRL